MYEQVHDAYNHKWHQLEHNYQYLWFGLQVVMYAIDKMEGNLIEVCHRPERQQNSWDS